MNYKDFIAFEHHLSHQPAARCERPYIGLLLLGTDHTLETDWAQLLHGRARTFTNRLSFSGEISPESLSAIAGHIGNVAQDIAVDIALDVMAFGCTSASIMIGDDTIAERLNGGNHFLPVTNPWRAAKAAFLKLNAKNIAILAPYPTDFNYLLYQSLTAEGFSVPVLGGFGLGTDTAISKITKESIFQGLETILKGTKADAIFLSCTNLRAVEHIAEIEARFGIPVVTSNQALLWHALTLANRPLSFPKAGILLESM